jgi:OmcA/MtrC family decaheme c-type cytochrome
MKSRRSLSIVILALVAILAATLTAQVKQKKRQADLDANTISYLRPGILVKVVSAAIAQDGTITARVKVTDPKGVPLDKDGITTPGVVTLRFIAAYIPAGKKQYVAYTTTVLKATLNSNPSETQAGTDSGGTFTTNAEGDYTYTFKTKAPTGFDPAVTHAIAVSAQRNLTEFMSYEEWAQTSNDVFNFVPNGSKVAVTRSVVSTQACNQCHDPLFAHGGSRLTVEMCIVCHTPQTVNPDTGHSQDMPVLIHKIHMGKNLPSVKAGTPYRIWHRGAWSDFSEVGFPGGVDELKTCEVCHQGGAQVQQHMTSPSRAACGACHDDINFATGKGHVDLPQVTDNMCANCHVAKGETEFDASIKGAHLVATRSTQLAGVVFELIRVDNAKPGEKPAVSFTVKDNKGNLLDISKLDRLSLLYTGPTEDYSGYVTEDARKAAIDAGVYVYTFTAPLPATAKGTFVVSIEGYKNVTVNPGTVNAATVRDLGKNKVLYFAIGSAKVTARRQIVSTAKCNGCHNTLPFHGGQRNEIEHCVICHNPGVTDGSQRATGDKAESINLKTMIHKIHTGKELQIDFTVMGRNQSVNNYNEVGYVGDRKDCAQCHLPGTFNLPISAGQIAQQSPRDYIGPTMQPVTAACLSCHTSKPAAAHALLMTSPTLGEACEACHGPNSEAAVSKVHAR